MQTDTNKIMNLIQFVSAAISSIPLYIYGVYEWKLFETVALNYHKKSNYYTQDTPILQAIMMWQVKQIYLLIALLFVVYQLPNII